MSYDDAQPEPPGAIDDERLRLIFTCCHPALAMETRVALTLRMVGGLTMPEIARAFLVQEAAMGQRITRAKAKIKAARIPYRVPSAEDLPGRVSGVLAVLFLVFNEGYLATGPDTDPVRHDLTAEAIRLTRLVRALMPEDGEVAGLLALMLLTEARRTARVSASGELVPLGEQDRGTWDAALIAEGHRLVRERLAAGVAPGRYQILAAINAVHTSARDARDTDWSQIVALYDQLVRLDPSPIVALNRAIAVAELDGPQVALAAVDRLEDSLAGYHAYHATRADLLRRLGRSHGVARGVRQGHRAGGQHRRDRLPDTPPRPAGVGGRVRYRRGRGGMRDSLPMAPGDTARLYHRLSSFSYVPEDEWPDPSRPPPLDHPLVLHDFVPLVPATLPPPWKVYPSGLPVTPLPRSWPAVGMSATATLAGRAVARPRAVDLPGLARLLHGSAGVVRVRAASPPYTRPWTFRAAGSAGGRFPLELYVSARGVADLRDGVYWYDPLEHALVLVAPAAAGDVTTLVATGVPWRTSWKYAERGLRHIYWDGGSMLAQTLALAESAGFRPRLWTRFPDADVSSLVGADGIQEFPIALVTLGEGEPAIRPGGDAARGSVGDASDRVPTDHPRPARRGHGRARRRLAGRPAHARRRAAVRRARHGHPASRFHAPDGPRTRP